MIEAIGLGFGSLDLHGDLAPDGSAGLLDWLGLGRDIPILIWLTSLLACFTLTGVALQNIAVAMIGGPLAWWLACGIALLLGALLNTLAANGLMRIMPSFETTVISTDDLLGRRGVILEGTARRGAPARAKVVDQYGQAHFIMVEPHNDRDEIISGQSALIVRREGPIFFVLPDENTQLKPI
ncbi:membrane protein implicated in regulation of membrane protease activity [Novosphingobium sediminicola]|uniref:Membrane protein implicated in regulation of membrane protease activity n=1 Tax=Novosphingobium sediminicola TaxID=563162 RepID=A0A7W6CKK5_9SPHN|nr:membrane protein implicated in regulation of membrane protease activity [Novosphingobium sediminicola]